MGEVLVVEDNELICDSLKSIIKSIDSKQNVYGTGYSAIALEYAINNDIDVFILDIQLMDYSGIKLAEKIREIDCYKMTPIVFITNDYGLELEAYRSSQCYNFISKPFKTEDIKNTLKILFEHGNKTFVENKKFSIKQKGFTMSIPQKDILYFESRNRKIIAVTKYEDIVISKHTQSDILKNLTSQFFRCQRAFIVNSEWIYGIDRSNKMIYLKNGQMQIPYSSKFISKIEGVIK